MKLNKGLLLLVFLFVAALGIKFALDTGEKSPLYLSGRIALSPDLMEPAKPLKTLFIVIYDLDSQMPMPYGAAKFNLTESLNLEKDFDFVLTKERMQLMGGGMASGGSGPYLPKRLRIKARLDFDGVAGLDQPGDITGEIPEVAFGSKDIRILLNKTL